MAKDSLLSANQKSAFENGQQSKNVQNRAENTAPSYSTKLLTTNLQLPSRPYVPPRCFTPHPHRLAH